MIPVGTIPGGMIPGGMIPGGMIPGALVFDPKPDISLFELAQALALILGERRPSVAIADEAVFSIGSIGLLVDGEGAGSARSASGRPSCLPRAPGAAIRAFRRPRRKGATVPSSTMPPDPGVSSLDLPGRRFGGDPVFRFQSQLLSGSVALPSDRPLVRAHLVSVSS